MEVDSGCDFILAVWAAGRDLRLELQRALKPLGLSDVKFGVLLSLYALAPEPCSSADLACHTGVTRPAMTEVLDQLEQCGWVVRERRSDDRRAMNVSLSNDGRDQVEKAIEVFFHATAELTAGVAPEKRHAAADVCTQLCRRLWARAPHHPPS